VLVPSAHEPLFSGHGFLVPTVDEEFYPKKDYYTVYYAERCRRSGRSKGLLKIIEPGYNMATFPSPPHIATASQPQPPSSNSR
jgi:hypothetical protein